MAVPGTFLCEDGDCIPQAPRMFADCHSVMAAMVGVCPHCKDRHWSLEVLLDTVSDERAMDQFCTQVDWDATFVAAPHWIAYASNTANGVTFQHVIGPLLVPRQAATHGPHGVSACGGGYFWRYALAAIEELTPKLEAVQRELKQATAGGRQ